MDSLLFKAQDKIKPNLIQILSDVLYLKFIIKGYRTKRINLQKRLYSNFHEIILYDP
jgi:hypothetical protein